MSNSAISQRLKFLIEKLNMDTRTFSQALGVSEGTTRNYFNRGSKPSSDYLEKINASFELVNLHWLITGIGEPLLTENSPTTTNTTQIKNNSGIGINNGTATQHITLEACQRELENVRKDAASYQREIALLEGQLKDKEEIITLLRATYNRPN